MCDIHLMSCTGATCLFDLLSQKFTFSTKSGHVNLALIENLLERILAVQSSKPFSNPFSSLAKNWGVHAKLMYAPSPLHNELVCGAHSQMLLLARH